MRGEIVITNDRNAHQIKILSSKDMVRFSFCDVPTLFFFLYYTHINFNLNTYSTQ